MKKAFMLAITCLLLICFSAATLWAQDKKQRGKFGVDERAAQAQRITFKPSTETFRWSMVMPWAKGLLFYDIASHMADSIRLASAGRLNIRVYSADELVPAMQSFDAVSVGTAEVGHDWVGYWKGKNEAFVAFGSVPFGLDGEGYNIWLYEKGGLELMQELYGRFNLYALPAGQLGQEMGLSSNKRATRMEDFKGMRIRTVGWYMDILNNMGASVTPLPGGEIFLALERGVLDAAEFSSPAMNYPLGWQDITKYAIQPGVHQPGIQCAAYFNMDAWKKLPEDLKWIVDISARETQLWSYNWINGLNAEAIRRFQAEGVEFVRMEDEAIIEFRKTTKKYLDGLKEQYPDVKTVLDSQEAFIEEYALWRQMRGGVAPWPYETFIGGQIYE